MTENKNRKLKLAIGAEIHSPNLGDGVIYDCMCFLVRRESENIEILPIDISGRSNTAPSKIGNDLYLRLIHTGKIYTPRLYAYLNYLRLEKKFRRQIQPVWNDSLSKADALLIGGGNLFQDNHLDFPVKLSILSTLAFQQQVPVHIVSCGFSVKWSSFAKTLVAPILNGAKTISVRDELSVEICRKQFNKTGRLAFDPAIWARDAYPAGISIPEDKLIGIGIIHPGEVSSTTVKANQPHSAWVHLWLDVISALNKQGFKVELFTNGGSMDYRFATMIQHETSRLGLTCRLAEHPRSTTELVSTLTRYQGIIAHRMHALMLSLAFGIPCVGLAWDNKIGALFNTINRPELCIPVQKADPNVLLEMLKNAMNEKINPDKILELKQRARLSIVEILETLK